MTRFEIEVNLYLYPTEPSGRRTAARGSYRPLGFLRSDPVLGLSGDTAHGLYFELGDMPLAPGERRRVNCFFIHPGSFDAFKSAKKLYVWEEKIVGEVTLAVQENSK